MNRVRHFVAIFAALGALLPALCRSADIPLTEMPKDGEIPYGKVVYVDDGKCPKGEVKEVIGGSWGKSVPCKVRCVKRSDGSLSK